MSTHETVDVLNSIDLFAGVGGWDLAARALGIADPLGIEIDEWACATRKANGLRTLRGDVRLVKPTDYPCDLLLASPPCQHFSASAPRRKVVSQAGYNIRRRTKWRAYSDEGRDLVQIPLKWALELQPSWIAFEQVPAVLAVWESHATALRHHGYSVWTGVLDAADYGVPQNRERAILIASRISEPGRPQALRPRALTIHPTIVCNRRSKGGIVVGRSLREGGTAISFAVAGELQTFPADYQWQGGVERKSAQIGNAMPPWFAEAILNELPASLERAV